MITRDPYGIASAVRPWDGPGTGGQKQARNLSGATAEEIALCQKCPFPDCFYNCHAKPRKGKGGKKAAQVAALHGQGMTDKEIGGALGLSAGSVFYYRARLGLAPNKPGRKGELG